MSTVQTAAILWCLAATVTAFLPMRYQYAPGTILLLTAPVVIYFIAREHGLLLTIFAIYALVSMFRRPLIHLARKVRP